MGIGTGTSLKAPCGFLDNALWKTGGKTPERWFGGRVEQPEPFPWLHFCFYLVLLHETLTRPQKWSVRLWAVISHAMTCITQVREEEGQLIGTGLLQIKRSSPLSSCMCSQLQCKKFTFLSNSRWPDSSEFPDNFHSDVSPTWTALLGHILSDNFRIIPTRIISTHDNCPSGKFPNQRKCAGWELCRRGAFSWWKLSWWELSNYPNLQCKCL